MAKVTQDIGFVGSGLSTDDSQRYIPNGDAPYRLHCMINEEGENGVLTNMKGCEQVVLPLTISFTASEVYSVVGSFYNVARRECYYFIHSLPYDSGGGVYKYDNKLLRYKTDTNTIELVFLDEGNYLGLSHDSLMKDIRMIETWLFFNPKGTEPKMIDVEMAYNYANNVEYDSDNTYDNGDVVLYYGGVFAANQAIAATESPSAEPTYWDRISNAYSDKSFFGQYEFDFGFDVLKQPPLWKLNFFYRTDTDFGANNMRNKVFRFAYRYQYFDNAYSVYSEHNAPSLPLNSEQYNGENIAGVTNNNYIELNIPLGIASLIKTVEVVFQEGEGDWKLMASIDRRSISILASETYLLAFYNNASYKSVSNTEVNVQSHAVPREAGAQEIINLNTLLYGRCKEGFDNIDSAEIDVELTAVPVELVNNLDIDTLIHDSGGTVGTYGADWNSFEEDRGREGQGGTIYYSILSFDWYTNELTVGDVFSITIVRGGQPTTYNYTITASDDGDAEALRDAIYFFIKDSTDFTASRTDPSDTPATYAITFGSTQGYPQITSTLFFTPELTSNTGAKQYGFKTGAHHPFCRFYYDKNLRRGGASVSPLTTVYVPTLNEEVATTTTVGWKFNIEWEVNDLPPTWARYWRWGYAGNSLTDFFVQYIVSSVTEGAGTEADKLLVDITPLQTIKTTTTATWNQFPGSIIDEWSWEKGDRIRFITDEVTPGAASTIGDVLATSHDFEILAFDETTNIITIQAPDTNPYTDGINAMVEIYRPKRNVPSEIEETENIDVYYEFGPLMPILNEGGVGVHSGLTQDQSIDPPFPATGRMTGGDVFHIMRTPSKPLNTTTTKAGCYHESMHWSDFYVSDYWDSGKIGVVDTIGEQTLNIIRFSNTYVQGTQLNGLSTFEALNLKEVNDIYGAIRAMREVGDTLKVYQDTKSSSILIGKQEYSDATGRTQVVTSNKVLGSIRYPENNYGTIYPESVTKNNRYVYGWDVYNGVVWRDSANGIFPISGRFEAVDGRGSYKMEAYFKAKAKALIESGVENVKVLTLWDEEYSLFYITFIDKANADNNETVVFHEGSNRWITFADISREETWNEFLFPVYSVVQGFLNGLNSSYNEDDGFTYFDIMTGADLSFAATFPTMTITPLAVTTTSSPNPDAGLQGLTITPLAVTVVVSSVDIDPSGAGWEWDEFGSSFGIDVTPTIPVGGGTITAKPSWLTVKDKVSGVTLSISSVITNGQVLTIYPTNRNLSADPKEDNLTITDGYSNSASVLATQNGNPEL